MAFRVILLTIALLVFSCGCLKESELEDKPDVPSGMDVENNILQDATTSTFPPGGVLDPKDIRGIVILRRPYYCTYEGFGGSMQIWIDGGKYNAIVRGNGKPTLNVLSDEVWVYTWEEGKTTGRKYQISKVIGLTGEADPEAVEANVSYGVDGTIYDAARIAASAQCNKTTIPEVLFTPPNKIRYQIIKAVEDDKH